MLVIRNLHNIDTFSNTTKKYDCIKELFNKNIEDILKKNSGKCTYKSNNEDIINKINSSDDPNLSSLKEFLGTNYTAFFNKNINAETLAECDAMFGNFYNYYKNYEDDQYKKKIEKYINKFVDKVNKITTRNRNKDNINKNFKTSKI